MHKYAVISLFPEMFKAITESGITSRAINNKLASLDFINPRDYTNDKYQSVDDTIFGGGPGMLMKPEPLFLAHEAAQKKVFSDKNNNIKTIYFAPHGKVLNQKKIKSLAESEDSLILVCGRYEGVDQRFIDTCVDEVVSIGDFVLSGGEIPAMTLLDAIFRLLPGCIKPDSALDDSFSEGIFGLLEAPQYTKPALWRDIGVPDVLLSGNHQKIKNWREISSLEVTSKLRPDLLNIFIKDKIYLNNLLSEIQKKWLENYILDKKNHI